MAVDTTTPNRNYTLPATGNNVNTWGPLLNANFSAIDSNISAAFPITTTGGTTTLTASNAANLFYNVTGALTSNAVVMFPFTGTFFLAANNTTGAFTLTFSATGAGNSASLAQGVAAVFYSDGTNVTQVATNSQPVGLALIGEVKNWPSNTLPANYQWANGQALSRTTFSALFAVYGTQFGAGDGSTTFNVPDLRGNVAAGVDAMGGAAAAGRLTTASIGVTAALGTIAGNQLLQSHSHETNDPEHFHGYTAPTGLIGNNTLGGNDSNVVTGTVATTTSAAATGISVVATGGGNSQNIQPTFVTNFIIFTGPT
jgi:microcystin-dependent protein